ncbi:GntR family transcriptional regulator [Nocardia asteroides]|uniref:GntR family transcriptional regulator n=1 Tax=Nocardia asteroides TaxID=1824 RepID=UPI001E622479|nr:GntR family transcriptional regulator [Nocardia asteroides]UGT64733.1 GntR family transcriptional regulator [Nocardia asteroides]
MARIPLREQVYDALRRDLAGGALPATERLREERLAAGYGVSRTPVREALARLLADGLVQRHADGLYPFRPRLDELDNLYELRIVLEARGLQRALPGPTAGAVAASGTADPGVIGTFGADEPPDAGETAATLPRHDLTAVRAELAVWHVLRDEPPEPGPALVAADERFHLTLLRAAGNPALADALHTVYERVRPVRTMDLPNPERIAVMTAEHIAVAEHLLAGELDAALRALTTHIDTSRAHVRLRAEQALEYTKLARAVRD